MSIKGLKIDSANVRVYMTIKLNFVWYQSIRFNAVRDIFIKPDFRPLFYSQLRGFCIGSGINGGCNALSFFRTSACVAPDMLFWICRPLPGSVPAEYRASQYVYSLPSRITVFLRILPLPCALRFGIRFPISAHVVCYHITVFKIYRHCDTTCSHM